MSEKVITICDTKLTVIYTYHPAYAGARERGTGLQLEPDEEASVELEAVSIKEGVLYDLIWGDVTIEDIEAKVLAVINEEPDEQ
jgi:hypothetical protein